MSATIHDVARRAGVSISTVSRVLNDSARVHPDKRALVLEAAGALGYSPNPAALSLLNKRTGGIGVLLPFVSGEFFSELLSGLDEAAQEHGLILVISTSHRSSAEFHKAIQVLDKRVDGLVIMAPEISASDADSILQIDTPVVFVNTYLDRPDADVLNFDNRAGALALTRHLVDLGHRHIALVKGPPDARDAQERADGVRAGLAEAGLPGAVEVPGGYTREAGFEAAAAIADRSPRPTAIVAANDYCALGLISALHTRGISVPGEIAVTGFDGLTSGQYGVPPLTTVRVPIGEMGRQAVGQLAARLRGDATPPTQQMAPVKLIVRESTAARALTDTDVSR
ncbi:LacI family DNA-binding transcriptional regulator [Rubrivirga sp. IMCC45206]|uniref:LacI family DNA-binding transcriptional regulator n=1 Tax=Rubrivirga sp. IMCC45206 TaxID=3391614 RepID=UPI00398FA1CF